MKPQHSHWLALLLCILTGLVVSTLPHLLAYSRTGSPTWIADHDERFYLAVGSQAFLNHPMKLADPVQAEGGPSLYKPLPLLPGVWLAKVLNIGPLGVGLAWRILAGISIGAAWYLLLRKKLGRTWLAALIAMIFLSDGGLIEARPIYHQAKTVAQIALGRADHLFVGKPLLHPEWRISTPGVTMVFLLAMIWGVTQALEKPSKTRIVIAGCLFGLLFYVYFYYWTAVGLALLLAILLDFKNARVYFATGCLGVLVGLPSVVSDFLLKQSTASDWLQRTDKFLPISRFGELISPKVILLIVVIALVWVIVKRRDLIFVWSLGAAGLILSNHQVITRLQIENFHWCYVWAPAISLLIVLVVVDEWGRRANWSTRFLGSMGLIAGLMCVSGLWLRVVEMDRSANSIENAAVLADYREQSRANPGAKFEPNGVIAGDGTFVDLSVILDNLRPLSNYATTLSPTVTNESWDERTALNAILKGHDRVTFEATERAILEKSPWGPWSRDPKLRLERLATRLKIYDFVQSNMTAYLNKYKVRYLALTSVSNSKPPQTGWSKLASGPVWDVFERGNVSP